MDLLSTACEGHTECSTPVQMTTAGTENYIPPLTDTVAVASRIVFASKKNVTVASEPVFAVSSYPYVCARKPIAGHNEWPGQAMLQCLGWMR